MAPERRREGTREPDEARDDLGKAGPTRDGPGKAGPARDAAESGAAEPSRWQAEEDMEEDQRDSSIHSAAEPHMGDLEGTLETSTAGDMQQAEGGTGGLSMKRTGSTLDVDEEFEGPDTSSLAAFLLSLISLNPSKPKAPLSESGSSSFTEYESEYGDSDDEALVTEGPVGLELEMEDARHREGAASSSDQARGAEGYAGDRAPQAGGSWRQGGGRVQEGSQDQLRRRREGKFSRESSAEKLSGLAQERGRTTPPSGMGSMARRILARLGLVPDAHANTPPRAPLSRKVLFYESDDVTVRGNSAEDWAETRQGMATICETSSLRSTQGSPSTAGIAGPAELSPDTGALVGSPGRCTPFHAGSALSPPRLPALSEESVLLTDDMRSVIFGALPALAQGREWVLLYSTMKHGISLLTLYRKSALMPGPCLVVVGDRGGKVFGGYSGTLLQVANRKYQGTSDTFMFSDVSGEPVVFRASGANRYFVLCMQESLAFGGGGHFALRLEEDLLSGSTGECETFRSPKLTDCEEFQISHVELWGFAHTSRYAPQSATWQEPTSPRNFHPDW